jgi:hypothetical protein
VSAVKPCIDKNLSAVTLAGLAESGRYGEEAVGKAATEILDRDLD